MLNTRLECTLNLRVYIMEVGHKANLPKMMRGKISIGIFDLFLDVFQMFLDSLVSKSTQFLVCQMRRGPSGSPPQHVASLVKAEGKNDYIYASTKCKQKLQCRRSWGAVYAKRPNNFRVQRQELFYIEQVGSVRYTDPLSDAGVVINWTLML